MSRELDALVAEKVLGWTCTDIIDGKRIWATDDYNGLYTPAFTTDAAPDYEVLKHVREKWDYDLCWQFSNALLSLYKTRRCNHPIAAYEPGDYSRAALKAMGLDVSAEVADGL